MSKKLELKCEANSLLKGCLLFMASGFLEFFGRYLRTEWNEFVPGISLSVLSFGVFFFIAAGLKFILFPRYCCFYEARNEFKSGWKFLGLFPLYLRRYYEGVEFAQKVRKNRDGKPIRWATTYQARIIAREMTQLESLFKNLASFSSKQKAKQFLAKVKQFEKHQTEDVPRRKPIIPAKLQSLVMVLTIQMLALGISGFFMVIFAINCFGLIDGISTGEFDHLLRNSFYSIISFLLALLFGSAPFLFVKTLLICRREKEGVSSTATEQHNQ